MARVLRCAMETTREIIRRVNRRASAKIMSYVNLSHSAKASLGSTSLRRIDKIC